MRTGGQTLATVYSFPAFKVSKVNFTREQVLICWDGRARACAFRAEMLSCKNYFCSQIMICVLWITYTCVFFLCGFWDQLKAIHELHFQLYLLLRHLPLWRCSPKPADTGLAVDCHDNGSSFKEWVSPNNVKPKVYKQVDYSKTVMFIWPNPKRNCSQVQFLSWSTIELQICWELTGTGSIMTNSG